MLNKYINLAIISDKRCQYETWI